MTLLGNEKDTQALQCGKGNNNGSSPGNNEDIPSLPEGTELFPSKYSLGSSFANLQRHNTTTAMTIG